MSQIEHNFRQFLSKNPELETCYQKGLINRRSLARYLVSQGIAKSNQMEAVIAMLRRFEFNEKKQTKDLFPKVKINLKDKIIILDFQKEKELIKSLQRLIESTNYDRGDTLKIVVGSSSVKVFLDEENGKKVKDIIEKFKLLNRLSNISEISITFPEDAITPAGVFTGPLNVALTPTIESSASSAACTSVSARVAVGSNTTPAAVSPPTGIPVMLSTG